MSTNAESSLHTNPSKPSAIRKSPGAENVHRPAASHSPLTNCSTPLRLSPVTRTLVHTTFLISCDDLTPTLGTSMILIRVEKTEDGAIRSRIEKASPGAMAFGASRNVDFSSINSIRSTLDPHERPLFDADMKKLYDDGEYVRLNAQLNMIATGRRTLVPFLYTVTFADLNSEALVGDDKFKASDEAMALLAFTTINAIRVVTVSAGYITLFGIDDSKKMLEASCLQNNSPLKHATLWPERGRRVLRVVHNNKPHSFPIHAKRAVHFEKIRLVGVESGVSSPACSK